MAQHNDLGVRGEEIARAYLLCHNYTIIAQNYRILKAEFDFIVRDLNQKLTFVEVKTRASEEDYAEKAVSNSKQKILFQGAENYKLKHQIEEECFFDVISIQLLKNQEPKILHIKDAFYDYEY